ncbi:unnamed protein product [Cunninghamella blakesleeana]
MVNFMLKKALHNSQFVLSFFFLYLLLTFIQIEAEGIIEEIKRLSPDICVLQEVDIHCERSGNRNHLEELCKNLNMKGIFVCEFLELHSPLRKLRDQGGGYHGNAILSKYDISMQVIEHKYQPFHWDKDGHLLNEPRKGKRYSLAGIIQKHSCPPIICYNVHLEVFTGIIGRISAFSELFEHAQKNKELYPHQVICGDLNTMAHSIARLSPKYANDRYRWLSLGETESSWWDRNVFGYHLLDGSINTNLLTLKRYTYFQPLKFIEWMIQSSTPWLSTIGLKLGCWLSGFKDLDVLKNIRNPGFYDVWSPHHPTLHNPAYFGLFKAKLDWTLVRNLNVTDRWFGNCDYKLSDHQWLMIHVDFDATFKENPYKYWSVRRNYWRNIPV